MMCVFFLCVCLSTA
ncbi:hypothetical protein FWK35_00010382 [Aphis craccivora]|uniref:Uncharacterized protein n=1 Tax=Aphis craccivora TaxID=307492 RepID=A0A6G0ZEY2_APHCR|nr:hypothetical protein FWK35_00010382 [Aphis craccivora]